MGRMGKLCPSTVPCLVLSLFCFISLPAPSASADVTIYPAVLLAQSDDCSAQYFDCPELGALLKLKAANLDPGGVLANWTIPCNLSATAAAKPGCQLAQRYACAHWVGQVVCDPVTHNITDLTVTPLADSSALWGDWAVGQSIPPELGQLGELRTLDLSGHASLALGGIIGTIPSELGNLLKLTTLSLAYNRLWGAIPQSLGNLSELKGLSLTGNNLTGELPSSLGNLRSLVSLTLNNNDGIQGPIPASYGGLLSLQYMSLAALGLSGALPETLSNLRNLISLNLYAQHLSGQLPSWLGNLQNLTYLDLSDNEFSGSLPAGLARLRQLVNLQLSTNKLSGVVPDALFSSLCKGGDALTGVYLASNLFEGPIPLQLSTCTNLVSLGLSDNVFNGTFPPGSFFRALPSLNDFDVGVNALTGTLPSELGSLVSLALVGAANNRLSGPIPKIGCVNSSVAAMQFNYSGNQLTGQLADAIDAAALARCLYYPPSAPPQKVVIDLDLSNNKLTGSVPGAVLSLGTLSELHLDGNNLTGALPAAFRCSPSLQSFSAAGNALTGPIPGALGTCKALLALSLAGNQLSGPIPDELKGLNRSLQRLALQENLLTGGAPSFLGSFSDMVSLNLSHNGLSGQLDGSISQLPYLLELDVSFNQLEGPIPADIGNLSFVGLIDLSNNQLSGEIPITIAPPNLPQLTFLDLSVNNLGGPIPWGFTNSSAEALVINLSSNNLSGAIPGGANSTFALTLPASAVANNSGLCGGSGYPPCPDPNNLSTGAIVGVSVAAAAGLVSIFGLTFWLLRKRNEWSGGTMMVFEKLDFHLTVDDILEATENFSEKYKLGRGGFGTVYRATLADGRSVAIKRLAAQSTQGDREFQAEMNTLGNIRHRNLVVLVAAYIAPAPSSERLLVYNFLSGGSLDNILSKEMAKDSPYREWQVRRSIALDVARGMKYLHHDCTPRIIHRDMKPANVLMDDQLVAHVADFGLARELDATKSHMSTAVFGTIGYLAPEYTQRGRLTFKSDVFAYGVLLLQLITGKQPTDEDVAERGLARWVGASATGSVIDERLEVGVYTNQIVGAVKLGLLCTSRVPADRPSMAEVVHLLENLDDFAKGISAPEDVPMDPDDAV